MADRPWARLTADVFFPNLPEIYSLAFRREPPDVLRGSLRQYFPKRRSLQMVSSAEVHHAQQRLNLRPRKCLAFRTPFEVFFQETAALTT